jgi:hypothetical protein
VCHRSAHDDINMINAREKHSLHGISTAGVNIIVLRMMVLVYRMLSKHSFDGISVANEGVYMLKSTAAAYMYAES